MENGLHTAGKTIVLFGDAAGFLSSAAVAAQAWDLMVSFSDEVEFLWGGSFRFTKGLYFGARYGILAMQVANQLLFFRFESTESHSSLCAGIFVFKVVIAQLALTPVEMILLVRVYALYNQSFKMKRSLMAVFLVTIALEFTGTGMIIQTVAKASGGFLLVNQIVVLTGRYSSARVGAGFCQSFVFAMTIAKLLTRGRRTPLASLILKEGVVSFILLFVLLAVILVYEIIRNLYLRDGNGGGFGHVAFSWYLAILSIAGSRLILNMRKLAFKHRSILRHEYGSEAGSSEDESVYLTSLSNI